MYWHHIMFSVWRHQVRSNHYIWIIIRQVFILFTWKYFKYIYTRILQYVSSVHKLSYLICIFYLFDQDISNGRKYIYANCIVDCLSGSLYLYLKTQSDTPCKLKALQILGSKLGYAVTFCIFILNKFMALIELHPLYCSFDWNTSYITFFKRLHR